MAMRLTESYISLQGLRFYAFHGVLPQETIVGGEYEVTLRVGYPLATAMQSDSVADTLNYADLYDLVKREMAQPSCLLEHVAGRIVEAIGHQFPQVMSIDLTVTKLNPPLGADTQGASVELHLKQGGGKSGS